MYKCIVYWVILRFMPTVKILKLMGLHGQVFNYQELRLWNSKSCLFILWTYQITEKQDMFASYELKLWYMF